MALMTKWRCVPVTVEALELHRLHGRQLLPVSGHAAHPNRSVKLCGVEHMRESPFLAITAADRVLQNE
jgi:hypothetical protein